MTSIDNYFKQIEGLGISESKRWLKQNEAVSSDLNNALTGFSHLPFAIPIFSGTAGKFSTIHPWHHVFFEANQDLDSAFLLLLTGFYKDSFRAARSFLELYIFALFHFTKGDEVVFQEWLEGKSRTPKMRQMLEVLIERNPRIHSLNDKFDWKGEVETLYRELSGFMHTQGASHTHSSLRNSNLTGFSEVGMETGADFLLRSMRLVGMGFSVNFPMSFHPLPLFDKFAFGPPAGGYLEEDQVERIRSIFEDNVAMELSKICMEDDEASSLADGIRGLPDLSEEEVFTSLRNTLDGEEFSKHKQGIIEMIKNGELNEAFAQVRAMQRALMHTITMVLYNPFLGQPKENKTRPYDKASQDDLEK